MNRFTYTAPVLVDGERTVAVENNVRLYDGDQKVLTYYFVYHIHQNILCYRRLLKVESWLLQRIEYFGVGLVLYQEVKHVYV